MPSHEIINTYDFATSEKRRGRDSNPREPFDPNGFQNRRLQPLGHLSPCCRL